MTTSKRLSHWPDYAGSALSFHLTQQSAQQFLVVMVPDALTLQRLVNELNFFRQANAPLLTFPDWETLPYDRFSPHQAIISQRLKTLALLPHLSQGILLLQSAALMQRLPPRDYITGQVIHLSEGDQVALTTLKQQFVTAGYRYSHQVMIPGEFAVRGSLFDIFPMGCNAPYRIDFFDNTIESICIFDPETQRTQAKIATIDLLPAREFPLTENAIEYFRQRFREQFTGNPLACSIYQAISQATPIAGSEYYLPLFFDQTMTLLDYLPANSQILRVNDVGTAAESFWQEIQTRYDQLRHDRTHPLLPPTQLFLSPSELFSQLKQWPQTMVNNPSWTVTDVSIDHKATPPLAKLQQFLQQTTTRVLLCAESTGRREALWSLLLKSDVTPVAIDDWQHFLTSDTRLGLTIAPLDQGLQLTDPAITLIPESALLGSHVLQQRRRKTATTPEQAIRHLAELQIGDAAVHLHHGVGRYLGLETLTVNGQLGEYLLLAYAGGDKIYVPVAALQLIHRYSGVNPDQAPLNKLGTDHWDKAKRKAAEKIRDVAAELLELHARRALQPGQAYPLDTEMYQLFANHFAFEETPDQQQAIEAVIADMCSEQRMDRLVCGDVGFGKTEVAMRAAFVATQGGSQVAVLVPTTLLAQQHYQNFCDRFADWPIRIGLLSRFRSNAEQQAALQQLAAGTLDIVIGTHKLIQPTIKFNNLGLVIIDEEHRFGVQQKERLKKLRAEVNILTLTATPIPRTLNMTMAGLRDLSIIGTPPARRLSIKTFVHTFNKTLIREAILREIMRGGQVFYLHNDVATIQATLDMLQTLVPEARFAIAHGQMRERDLEQIMREFYHQQFNVLICTTIIETGIDIPSANTILIERADKFGLAQLHQLRGRVGRSHHQAYAYLFTPDKVTSDAEKRLQAISHLEELGAGFTLATQDLEIRGAGEILGEEQSGQVQAIGFNLYMDLLDRAVATLKKGQKIDLAAPLVTLEIDLQLPALIPEDYIGDVHTRLMLYKRLSQTTTVLALSELQVEFIDRFGLLPAPVKNLFAINHLRLVAENLGIKKITGNAKSLLIEFSAHAAIDIMKILKLIQQQPQQYKLENGEKLRYWQEMSDHQKRLACVEALLKQVTAKNSA